MLADIHGWLTLVQEYWLHTLGWLAGMTVGFALLARWMPCNPGMFWWKDLRACATDAVYWFIVPLFLRVCRTLMLIVGVALLFDGRDPQPLPVRNLPLWLQCVLILVLQDILLYWVHRAFHTRLGWGFHAVHHSPQVLDWTATARFHPLNNLLAFSLADVTVLLLGFTPAALVVLTPFNVLYSALVHANLNWTFGPLRYVLASPVFHRWHHTTLSEGLDKNFASTFPILDVLFGTFYLPPGKLPEHFGTGEPDFPRGFWGQFLHPFSDRATAVGAWVRSRPATAAVVLVGLLAGGAALVRISLRIDQLAEQNARLAAAVNPPRLRQVLTDEEAQSPAAALLAIALSADGRRIVTGDEDGLVKVWDREGRLARTLFGHQRLVRSVAISADGRWIASGSYDCTSRLWDAESGQEVRSFTGHRAGVLAVALSADGRRLLCGSGDFTARLWDAQTGQPLLALARPPDPVLGVALSGDGRYLATTSGDTVRLWDAVSGAERRTLRGHADYVYSVAFSADGRRVLTGSRDGTARVWDTERGQTLCILSGQREPIYAVALSPDGRTAVSGGSTATLRIWDTATGRELSALSGHTGEVSCVAMTGSLIVSGDRDGVVRVWSLPPRSGEGGQQGEASLLPSGTLDR